MTLVITLQVASGFNICEGLGARPGKNLSCLRFSPSGFPGSFVEVGLSPEAAEPGVSAWLAGLAGHSAYGLLALRSLPGSMPPNGSCSSAPLFAAAAVSRSSNGKPEVAPESAAECQIGAFAPLDITLTLPLGLTYLVEIQVSI